jgi:hypothetical protein
MTYAYIAEQTGASKATICNIANEVAGPIRKPGVKAGTGLSHSPRANPTACTHRRDCQCVYHRAEAYKREKGLPT